MNRARAIAILKQNALELKALGVLGLSLIGSTARDEANDESDIDVIVSLTDGPRGFPHLDRLDHLKEMLEGMLGRPVDVMTAGAGSPRFRQAVARDRIDAF